MSCNGCRVLRKGCSESCILRPCLQWIDGPEAQGHATVFVAKFFGRAGLMSFLSSVPESQRPALFQSLLFEACGRTVNPVNGAVGLLWTGNWQICQAAVETVLRGGSLRAIPSLLAAGESGSPPPISDEASEIFNEMWRIQRDDGNPTRHHHCRFSSSRSKTSSPASRKRPPPENEASDLVLRLNPCRTPRGPPYGAEMRRPGSPSMNSEESVTTSCWESGSGDARGGVGGGGDRKLLNLFV